MISLITHWVKWKSGETKRNNYVWGSAELCEKLPTSYLIRKQFFFPHKITGEKSFSCHYSFFKRAVLGRPQLFKMSITLATGLRNRFPWLNTAGFKWWIVLSDVWTTETRFMTLYLHHLLKKINRLRNENTKSRTVVIFVVFWVKGYHISWFQLF